MLNTEQLYTINPLFDFQILCDSDIGLYRLIKDKYYDRDIFDTDLFDSNDEQYLKTVLLTRTHFNPLFIFCKKGVLSNEDMDSLYEQFLNEEYENILKLSPPSDIAKIATLSNTIRKVVNVTVLIKNEAELKWLQTMNKNLKYIMSDYKDLDISKYDTLYIKDIYSLLLFKEKSLVNKNIIYPKYLFNLETATSKLEVPIVEVSKKFYKDNTFLSMDPYKDIVVPITEMAE